jgi:TPR repeat protein/predicted aspartyl protease
MYAKGQGVPTDNLVAVSWFRMAADRGYALAQKNLGFMYRNGLGVSQDYSVAVGWYRKAADQGHVEAQYDLGNMYRDGLGVPRDVSVAVSLYRKAADQGFAEAQYNLGSMYWNGLGVPRDVSVAVSWLRKAADQGLAVAQYQLGQRYEKGEGVPADDSVAVSWFRKAADRGLAVAQAKLGFMYAKGQGVPPDDSVAVSLYRKAADQGFAEAQYNLGARYAKGVGVPQNYVSAHMWFNLAAAAGSKAPAGFKDAASSRDSLAAEMTQTQIAEAQRLADQWRLNRTRQNPAQIAVPLQLEGGTFTVPVSINDKLTLNFVLDSGASDVSIPADVVLTLMRTGTLSAADFLGAQIYRLADGSTLPSQTFRIKSLKLGEKTIENVTGSIGPAAGDPLLGQSFLRRFKSWSIDNQQQVLVLE